MSPVRLAVFVLCVLAGCGGPDRGQVRVYPVEGKLLVGDLPAANARVAFHPAGGPVVVGVTQADGTFRLTTYTAGDGAPAGEYVVTVLWPNDQLPADDCEITDPAAHDRLRGQYLDSTKSPLRATVRPETNRITLHATVGDRGWNLPRQIDLTPNSAAERRR